MFHKNAVLIGAAVVSLIMLYGILTKISPISYESYDLNMNVNNNTNELHTTDGYENYSDTVKRRISEALYSAGNNSESNSTSGVAPFLRMKAIYRLAPEYHISTCEIEKSMSTLLVGIFCYLFDTENFILNNRTIESEWWDKRYCIYRNEAWTTLHIRRFLPGPHETIYVVREPLERFISAFVDKCINERSKWDNACYNCSGNLDCVIPKAYAEIMDYALGRRPFEQYPLQISYTARHFAPQTWYCDLKDRYRNYTFIKYANDGEKKMEMVDKIIQFLRHQGVQEEKIMTVRKAIIGGKTVHSTHGSSKSAEIFEKIKANPEHRRMLSEMFEMDYRIFDFPRKL